MNLRSGPRKVSSSDLAAALDASYRHATHAHPATTNEQFRRELAKLHALGMEPPARSRREVLRRKLQDARDLHVADACVRLIGVFTFRVRLPLGEWLRAYIWTVAAVAAGSAVLMFVAVAVEPTSARDTGFILALGAGLLPRTIAAIIALMRASLDGIWHERRTREWGRSRHAPEWHRSGHAECAGSRTRPTDDD